MTRSRDELREAILTRLCEALDCPASAIDPSAPFASYGLGSRDAVVLSGDLEEWLGEPLSPTLFYEHPTLDALVDHLASGGHRPSPVANAGAGAGAATHDDIAIIGLSCRFPGAADATAYWSLLDSGREAIRTMPDARQALMGADLVALLPQHGRLAGYVDDADAFDAPFFGIPGPEAEGLDPQQRFLLELAWHALEDAGQDVDRLAGTRTGVFVGVSTSDYALLRTRLPEAQRVDTYFGTSNSPSVAAGRIAYAFGLQGPVLAVDTACSSSLAAVHLAGRSLRSGEADLAIAAGVNLILAPETSLWACRARILSEDGQCRTFDKAANGYVRGEGAGVVVLKRLAEARRDGDPIVAVIRGSAMNHDGRSSGLTAPNGIAQAQVIAAALADAGVTPSQVHYVEAHGTGTPLGDPIEVRAIGAALCAGRDAADPLVIGSVKTNVGHLEAAAGVAGLIKVALALRQGRIPPHLHLRELNPYIAAERLPIEIAAHASAWPVDDPARVAGVSSFGLSGTNVHVVLGRAPATGAPPEPPTAPTGKDQARTYVLPISARSETALARRVATIRSWLRREQPRIADVCATSSLRRAHHRHRVAAWGADLDAIGSALEAWIDGRPHPGMAASGKPATAAAGRPPTTAEAAERPPATAADDAAVMAARYVRGEDVDWRLMCPNPGQPVSLPSYPFDRHRYWIAREVAVAAGEAAAAVSGIAARIEAAPAKDRDAILLEYLRAALGRVLQVPAAEVAIDVPFAHLGLDSLMAIDLTNRLASELAVQVPPVDLLEKTTLAELVTLVLDLREAARVRARAADATGASADDTEEVIL